MGRYYYIIAKVCFFLHQQVYNNYFTFTTSWLYINIHNTKLTTLLIVFIQIMPKENSNFKNHIIFKLMTRVWLLLAKFL